MVMLCPADGILNLLLSFSLLTASKTLSSLSALRDAGWRDGCY